MVIKGSARGGAASLAQHLQRTDTNERMELRELRGVMAEDLDKALQEMEAVASGARSARHFYHASINTRADEVMTPEQWQQSVDRLERELDLTDQPRAVVAHVKEGRAHVHVVWSRIDLETMTAIPDSHNYRRHELVARELEQEFEHERVQGAHIGREGERPERTPTHAEMQQAERTGIDSAEAKAQLTEIWNRTDSGRAFAAAIEEQGWILARGDRRDFVVVDQAGEAHSLARRIEGAKAKDIRARMSDVEAQTVPSVDEAREAQRRAAEQARIVLPAVAAPLPPEPTPEIVKENRVADQVEQATTPPQIIEPAPLEVVVYQPEITLSFGAMNRLEIVKQTLMVVVDAAEQKFRELVDYVGELLESFLRPAAPKPTSSDEAREADRQRQAEKQQRGVALDRIGDTIAQQEAIQPTDLKQLNWYDLHHVQAKGDEGLRELIRQRQLEEERRRRMEQERDQGRER
jgi:hypothetical protein